MSYIEMVVGARGAVRVSSLSAITSSLLLLEVKILQETCERSVKNAMTRCMDAEDDCSDSQ